MKRLLFTFALFVFALYTTNIKAQNLSNSGFENWSMVGFPTMTDTIDQEMPDNWTPMVSMFGLIFGGEPIEVYKSTDSHTGSYAAKFKINQNGNGGDLMSLSQTNARPDQMRFWYKKSLPSDTVNIMVGFGKYNAALDTTEMIGMGQGYLVNIETSYAEAIMPITFMTNDTPDSMMVWIDYTSGTPGGEFLIDDITFTTIGMEETSAAADFNVYPNPATDAVTIEHTSIENAQYSIYSISGQEVLSGELNETALSTTIDLNELQPGMYLLKVNSGDEIYTERIIVR